MFNINKVYYRLFFVMFIILIASGCQQETLSVGVHNAKPTKAASAMMKEEEHIKDFETFVHTVDRVTLKVKQQNKVEAKVLTASQKQEAERKEWMDNLEARHQAVVKQGNIYSVKSKKEIDFLMANTKYLTITFYNNWCFASTQPSYNMIHNQPSMLKRIPDMVFVNLTAGDYPELEKMYQVTSTPYTVLVDKGQAVVGSPGFYDNDGLEKLMREFLDVK